MPETDTPVHDDDLQHLKRLLENQYDRAFKLLYDARGEDRETLLKPS